MKMSRLGWKFLVLFITLEIMFAKLDVCDARKNHWRSRRDTSPSSSGRSSLTRKPHPKPSPSPSPHPHPPKPSPNPPPPSPPSPQQSTLNVMDFGAQGDGTSDDTKAFQSAWAAACGLEASTIVVPSGYKFLVGPISFSGPACKNNIVFQLDGMIIAPTNPKAWGSGLLHWLEFKELRGLTIQGGGIIEGQGNPWWSNSPLIEDQQIATELNRKMPSTKPTALRIYGSYNVTVKGIIIQNSPQFHLKFDSCEAVQVFNMTVSSPADSPNTDGIHLYNSVNVDIHHVKLGCGDDCISIQTGCSDVFIHDIDCGPGHGISIGGLGKDNTEAIVSDITVQDIDLHSTTNGVRIKTWQGGSGSVQNIKYSNINVYDVEMPIVIDQFYCDHESCKNQTSAVALSGITYSNIKGTYTHQPVHLACSDSIPCSDISLTDIELQEQQEKYHIDGPFCWQAYGELHDPTIPPIDCLQSKNSTNNLT